MRQLFIAALLTVMASQSGAAECYADYKAKRGNPLELHYGVIRITGKCKPGAAKKEIAGRIGGDGWTVLNVLSVFGPDGLDNRRANAGAYFLRY